MHTPTKHRLTLAAITALVVMCIAPHGLAAQERQVRGKITAAPNGGAVAGAEIWERSTGLRTCSDANGAFILTVSASDALLLVRAPGFRSDSLVVTPRDAELAIQLQPTPRAATPLIVIDDTLASPSPVAAENRGASNALIAVDGVVRAMPSPCVARP